MSIPCFIINRDRFGSTKNMVEYLNTIEGVYPVILDNDSAYEPLLEWYETKPCEIEMLHGNFGNCVLWTSPNAIESTPKPEFFDKYDLKSGNGYLVSDSDLDISGVPKDFVEVMKEGVRRHPNILTVGLSLEIYDLANTVVAKEFFGWEQMNWSMTDDMYIKAPVDTTMAYYYHPSKDARDFDRCLRIRRPYTAKHLSCYYSTENIPPEDELFYLSRITADFNHYSIRLKKMLEQ